jgi:hypothetical protein
MLQHSAGGPGGVENGATAPVRGEPERCPSLSFGDLQILALLCSAPVPADQMIAEFLENDVILSWLIQSIVEMKKIPERDFDD